MGSAEGMLPSHSDIVLPCEDLRSIRHCSSSRARDEARSTDMLVILSSSMAMCAFLDGSSFRRAALIASSLAIRRSILTDTKDMLQILSSSMAMCSFLDGSFSLRAALIASSSAIRRSNCLLFPKTRFVASESGRLVVLFGSLLIITGHRFFCHKLIWYICT